MNIGELLRETRINKELTVEQVARDLLIQEKYVDALEEGRFELIPGEVYQRAYFNKYAEYLGLKDYIDNLSKSNDYTTEKNENSLNDIFGGTWDTARFARVGLKFLIFVILPVTLIVWFASPKSTAQEEEPQESLQGTQTLEVLEPEETFVRPPDPVINNPEPVLPMHEDDHHVITLSARGSCWVTLETRDASLFNGTMLAGDIETYTDQFGFHLHAGRPEVLDVELDGQPVDWEPNTFDMILPPGAILFEEPEPEPEPVEEETNDPEDDNSGDTTEDSGSDPDESGNDTESNSSGEVSDTGTDPE